MANKILKYVTLTLAITATILIIINLVNYYSYTNALKEIQDSTLDLISKFELHENKELYLYRTLRLIPWSCFVSLATIISGISTLFTKKKTKNYNKIR